MQHFLYKLEDELLIEFPSVSLQILLSSWIEVLSHGDDLTELYFLSLIGIIKSSILIKVLFLVKHIMI